MSAAEEHVDAGASGNEGATSEETVTAKAKHVLPTEGRRALVATALGAGLGLLAALFSRRDRAPGD